MNASGQTATRCMTFSDGADRLAGFIASVEQWAAYENALTAILADFGVKKFHAIDARQRKGDFKGWTRTKLARFNSQFLKLADDHLACGMAMILPSESYQRIYRSALFPRKARPDSQIALCMRAAVWKALLFMKDRPGDWPLDIVMEAGSGREMDSARAFFEVKEGLVPELSGLFGNITFGSKDDLPLAIADSLAYAIFRMSAGYASHPTEPNAAPVGPSDPPYYVSKIPMSRTLVDETTLAFLRDDLGAKATA